MLIFVDPPTILKESDLNNLTEKLQKLPENERIIVTYIPEKIVFDSQ